MNDMEMGTLLYRQVLAQRDALWVHAATTAMVLLCLKAREFDPTVNYVVLDDIGDGSSGLLVLGLSAGIPMWPGHFSTELDRDPEDRFEDEGFALSLDSSTEVVWRPYVTATQFLPEVLLLDVEAVLALPRPWAPADDQIGLIGVVTP